MPYTFQVTIDAADPHPLADWWADALQWEVEPSDEGFIRQMVAQGHATEADTMTHRGVLVWQEGAAIRHPGGPAAAPRVYFQRVPEAKTVKNREGLVAKGATLPQRGRQGPHTWVTVADPEGNELCVSR